MRRLIAYLTLAAAVVLGIAFNLSSVVTSSNVNWEFSNGKQFVYRISDKEDETAVLPDGTVDDIANTMIDRLETANVSKYDVETEGENQVRVTLAEDTATSYARLKQYLGFDGEFSICTTKDTCMVGDEVFEGSTARIEYKGQYPIVVIPLSEPTKFTEQIIAEAQEIQGDTETDSGEYDNATETSTTQDAMILLWANKTESDTYEASQEDSDVAAKVIISLDYTRIWYDEDRTEIAAAISPATYGTADESNVFPVSAVEQANAAAHHYVNLFNASSLDYKVEFLFDVTVDASIESLLSFGLHASIAWSSTVIATLIGLLILFAGIVVFYRLSGVSAIVTTSAALFLTLLVYNLVGMEITGATLIGAVAVIAMTMASAVLYFSKLKNELYKGRSLKKANAEASKKSFWPTLDISIVAFLFGLGAYFLGGPLVQAFSVFVIFGAVANAIVVLFGLKGMMWLLTNTTSLQGKVQTFGVDPAKVPNAMSEEKQIYFGRFAEKDFTKKAPRVGLISGVFAAAGVAMMLIFGLTSGSVFASQNEDLGTRIYFQTMSERSDIDSTQYVEDNILDFITIDGEALPYEAVTLHEMTKKVEEVDVEYRFYVVEIAETIDLEAANASYVNGATTYDGTLLAVLQDVVTGIDNDSDVSSVSVHAVASVVNQPSAAKVSLAVLLGMAMAAFYIFLRYRLSRGVAALAISVLSSFLTLAFFAITRIPTTAPITLSVLLVGFFALVISLLVFNKERELFQDAKETDKKAIIAYGVKAVGTVATPLLVLTFLVGYIGINFFGFGPSAYALTFAAVALGVCLSALFVTSILIPTANSLEKLFARFNVSNKLPRSARARARQEKAASKNKSAEPQEAVFIGIND